MIKFFRQLRQKLLMENNNSKYFKYAIGEILLVVVGILIALQINNWNDDRKQKLVDQKYFQNLKNDLIGDTERLDLMITYSEEKVKAAKRMMSPMCSSTATPITRRASARSSSS